MVGGKKEGEIPAKNGIIRKIGVTVMTGPFVEMLNQGVEMFRSNASALISCKH